MRFLFCIRIGPVFQQSLTQRLGAGVVVDLRQHLQVTVSQQACHHVRVDALGDPERREGVPLRYNYDKPEKPRISRVFGYLARFFILFQTEKSSREVMIF